MEWQLGNALFIAITTMGTFVVIGGAAKLLYRPLKWRWVGWWLIFGLSVVLFQVLGTASPKFTLHVDPPEPQEKEITVEKTDLIPAREIDEWREKIDRFDEKQDQRVKENNP